MVASVRPVPVPQTEAFEVGVRIAADGKRRIVVRFEIGAARNPQHESYRVELSCDQARELAAMLEQGRTPAEDRAYRLGLPMTRWFDGAAR